MTDPITINKHTSLTFNAESRRVDLMFHGGLLSSWEPGGGWSYSFAHMPEYDQVTRQAMDLWNAAAAETTP